MEQLERAEERAEERVEERAEEMMERGAGEDGVGEREGAVKVRGA